MARAAGARTPGAPRGGRRGRGGRRAGDARRRSAPLFRVGRLDHRRLRRARLPRDARPRRRRRDLVAHTARRLGPAGAPLRAPLAAGRPLRARRLPARQRRDHLPVPGARARAWPLVGAGATGGRRVRHGHTLVDGARWYGIFPPGWPALLAAGYRVALPWLVNPLLAFASVGLFSAFTRRAGLDQVEQRLATAVVALSPFLVFLSGTYMSHTASLF